MAGTDPSLPREAVGRPSEAAHASMKKPAAWARVVGAVLVVVAAVSFATIADDLRHVGELLGVGAVLAVGVLLLLAGSARSRSSRAASLFLAGFIGAGALLGAASDRMAIGVGAGTSAGMAAAAVALRRGRRAAVGPGGERPTAGDA